MANEGFFSLSDVRRKYWEKRLYKITLFVGVAGPLTNLPQLLEIYITRNATGVSELSWFLYLVADIPFILWGIVRNDKPVFATYSLWFISNLFILVGALVYG